MGEFDSCLRWRVTGGKSFSPEVSRPSEVRFAEVRRVLERHGWTLDRIASSHFIFRKEGEPRHINLPVHHGKVAPKYVKKLEKEHGIRV